MAFDGKLSPEEQAKVQRLRDDFEFFSRNVLRIRTKSGEIKPFVLNRAQRYLHQRLEDQRRKGKVRAIILKGRQLGASTYIQGRFYWRLWGGQGLKAFILTHEQAATDNMFAMAQRFHDGAPVFVKPRTKAANAKELAFADNDCSYSVGTAGTKGVGRSSTLQLFHGCLGIDTPIVDGLTGKLRAMKDWSVGELVRTHTGEVAPVTFISRQAKEANRVTLKGLRGFPLVATDEHRFWTREGWKELGDIAEGDCIGFPVAEIVDDGLVWPFRLPDSFRPQGGGSREVGPNTVSPSYDLGRVLGLYLAEGSIARQSSGVPSAVTFTVHEREVDRTVEWLKPLADMFRSVRVANRSDSKTCTVTVYGRSFATFVEGLCGAVDSKRMPAAWCRSGEAFARGLVHGYLAGDGHSEALTRRISAPSIRSAITIGMRDALAALGYGWASIAYKAAAVRYGRNEKEAWTLRLTGEGVDRLASEIGWLTAIRQRTGAYGSVEVSGGYAWLPVVEKVSVGLVEVMDFEVDHDDHSYCTIHGATHNSEVGFWPNAETHIDGAFQAIADVPGTERLLESTANGIGNVFQRRYAAAQRGDGDEEAIFVPWYWGEDYEREAPEDWCPPGDWEQYQHSNALTREQLYWAFCKNRDMASAIGEPDDKACWKFMQEFPASADEAFQTAGNSFIPSPAVAVARKNKIPPIGTMVIGLDPARGGGDKTGVVDRVGRVMGSFVCERWDDRDLMVVAGKAFGLLKKFPQAIMNIDVGGLGAGVYDRLAEMGLSHRVNAVNFGSSPLGIGPTGDELYANRRAEMWDIKRDWYMDPAGVQVPDDDVFHADETSAVWGSGATRHSSNNELTLESKDKIRERLGFSPDLGDAAALTFAVPVGYDLQYSEPAPVHRGQSSVTGY